MSVTHPKFKAAAVQAAPVFLDLDKTVDKSCHADQGSRCERRVADRLPGDFHPRLSVVHLAGFARMEHAIHPALSRQFAGLRLAAS